MQVNIKAIFEQKRYLVLFLLFMLGAYVFVQSVLTRGETQYVADKVEIPLVNEVKPAEESEEANVITPEVLGDRVVNYDNFFAEKQPNLAKKLADKPKVSILTDENEAPKIVLGYKEGLNEAWDICSDIELAKSFGFDTSACQSNNAEGQLATNITFGNGGGNNGGAGGSVVNPEPVTEPVEEVYASSSQAILTSFKIGGQEVMGKIGSEPMSRTEAFYKPGAILKVVEPYTFTGVEVKTATNVGQIMVYIYQENQGWSTWDSNYEHSGGEEALANFVLKNKAVVAVKVVSEDFSTTKWYKAKVFEENYTDSLPSFLTRFEVGGRNVLGLFGLQMDYHSLNIVDFGADLFVPDFTDFKGVTLDIGDLDNFKEAKVLIYHIGWSTWDLKYDGAMEDLANASIYKDDIIILRLKDLADNSFWYRVNAIEGLEEATEVSPIHDPEPEVILNSDSSLKTLLVGEQNVLNLPGAYVGDDWSSTTTGAVLSLPSVDDLLGVFPTANDEIAKIKVSIFRDYWTTWEYHVGLEMVAKEKLYFGDKIVVEVTAQDGTKSYYQVEIAKKLKLHENFGSIDNLSSQEAIKSEPVEELKSATAERGPAIGGKNTDNDEPKLKTEDKIEAVTEKIEASTDNQNIVE